MSSNDSAAEHQSFWENHVHAWRNSALSKARYCREHQLRYHQFIYWAPKFDIAEPTGIDAVRCAPKFLPVAVKPQPVLPELQITLPNGAIISGIGMESAPLVGILMAQL